MDVLRLAAFSEADTGGNPAGVCLLDALPDAPQMMAVAADVGFSETAFACPTDDAWRVRYFAPEAEVPFCGHATIALGAALARAHGDGLYRLRLNEAEITVEGKQDGARYSAALQSPPTRSNAVADAALQRALGLLGISAEDLSPDLAPQLVHGGADHLALTLKSRETLAAIRYDFDTGKKVMTEEGWTTIMLSVAETPQIFHVRNLFAFGGVYEDPATGAAAAAYAGYLNAIGWPHGGRITLIQGEDMGARSKILVDITSEIGASVRVSGEVRII